MTSPAFIPPPSRWPARAAVVINPVRPNRDPRTFPLGVDLPTRTDGLGGWQEITRPRRKSLTEYVGPAVDKLDVPILLDGFPHTSVQADVDWLVNLGQRDGFQSPVFKVTGPIWLSGQLFVLSTMDWGELYRDTYGRLVRQALTLHCWKYEATDALITSIAKKQRKASKARSYTVKKGDTLRSIATKQYRDPSRWHDIADANNLSISATHHLKPGRVLKLP